MIKPLTSLRFFFAFLVFLSHLNFVSKSDSFFTSMYESYFKEGYIGVSFFFILSGFVLALNYKCKFINKQYSFKDFYIARIARIYPLHLATLLLAVPLFVFEFSHQPIYWLVKFIVNLFLLQAFIPIGDIYFSFNYPSWSISDEMFFYLMFPIIILLFSKRNIMFLGIVSSLIIPIGIYLSSENIEHQYFYVSPFFRIIDFMIGVLLFSLYEKNPFSNFIKSRVAFTLIEILSLILFIVFFMCHQFIPQGYRYSCYYWIPMISIIFVFAYQKGYVSLLLSKKGIILLGEISFSFYLLHQLIIYYIRIINDKILTIESDYLLIGIIFIVTLLCSFISYKIIEQPFNKLIKKV